MLIPILDEVIGAAAEGGVRNILIGMAHRARVSVLAHVLHKPYAQILAEFKDPMRGHDFREDLGWTGDVKYHAGARRALKGGKQIDLVISIPPNPSHLEAIDPVVEGMAARRRNGRGRSGPPRFDPTHPSGPHSRRRQFRRSGSGSRNPELRTDCRGTRPGARSTLSPTTSWVIPPRRKKPAARSTPVTWPVDSRSRLFMSMPTIPKPASRSARLAFAYRARFHRDFLIDLVGYRRYGHNESG